MNKFYYLIYRIIFLSILCNTSSAQQGTVDLSFGSNGVVKDTFGGFHAVAVQPDGKIVAVGFYNPTGDRMNCCSGGFCCHGYVVLRLNPDGTRDAGFGNGGRIYQDKSKTNEAMFFTAIHLQADKKILLAGTYNQQIFPLQTRQLPFLMRLNENGSIDSSFGVNGIVKRNSKAQSSKYTVYQRTDGKIIASAVDSVSLYSASGVPDPSFKTVYSYNLNFSFWDILHQPDGKFIAVDYPHTPYPAGIIRFLPDGTFDSSFQPKATGLNFDSTFFVSAALQSDGKIIVTSRKDNFLIIVRYKSNGDVDSTYSLNGVSRIDVNGPINVADIRILKDSSLLMNVFRPQGAGLLKINPRGTIDSSFGRSGFLRTYRALDVALQSNEDVVVVGEDTSTSAHPLLLITRYLKNAKAYYNNISGTLFLDKNGNNMRDHNEPDFKNAKIIASKGTDSVVAFTSTGNFSLDVDTGSYITSVIPYPSYYNVTPASYSSNNTNYFNHDTLAFAIQPIAGSKDLSIAIVPITPLRPGFDASFKVIYFNRGTDVVPTGYVTFIKDSNFIYSNATLNPAVITGDTLRWNFTNLNPLDTVSIIINGKISAPPTVNIGYNMCSRANIYPDSSDLFKHDNHLSFCQNVVGSYDPNDKTERHAGKLSISEVAAEDYLYYTIRFQNTGTDTAFNIYVKDTLDTQLQLNTFEMVSSSHNYQMTKNDNQLVWTFGNIKLVDSNANELLSHGYITYKIKARSNISLGSTIKNSASIYFDYNLPIITNTETTTIVADVMPVKLLAFNARRKANKNILDWLTTDEEGFSRFEIERSPNGRDYTSIGSAKGGSKTYEFIDANPLKQLNYYRLKMIDRDNSFKYSMTRLINAGNTYLVTAYPNPVKDKLQLLIEAEKKNIMQVQVVSQDGRVLLHNKIRVSEGSSLSTLNVSALAKGIYYLKVNSSDKEQVVLKFEKQY